MVVLGVQKILPWIFLELQPVNLTISIGLHLVHSFRQVIHVRVRGTP